jgi:hypothetical protein
MATNKPPGDNARRGAVRKRSQLTTKMEGEGQWTKWDVTSGEFMSRKKDPKVERYEGIRRER